MTDETVDAKVDENEAAPKKRAKTEKAAVPATPQDDPLTAKLKTLLASAEAQQQGSRIGQLEHAGVLYQVIRDGDQVRFVQKGSAFGAYGTTTHQVSS